MNNENVLQKKRSVIMSYQTPTDEYVLWLEPKTSLLYHYLNGKWHSIGRVDIKEAPEDGKQYVRINGEWEELQFLPYDSLVQKQNYFYEIKYSHEDYEYAKKVLKNKYIPVGACSSFRKGNIVGRNYDWYYDNSAGFLVRTERNGKRVSDITDEHYTYRYKVMGVSGSIPGLTADFVQSRQYSEQYKLLPFLISDGINEHGLECNMNVVPTSAVFTTGTTPAIEQRESICGLMLVRYILDNFKTGIEAINYINNYVSVYMPLSDTLTTELHYMIADRQHTYVLEFINNELHYKELKLNTTGYLPSIVTNYHLIKPDDNIITLVDGKASRALDTDIEPYGQGLERYNLIVDADLNPVWEVPTLKMGLWLLQNTLKYSNSYTLQDNPWFTEFVGPETKLTIFDDNSKFVPILLKAKVAWQRKNRNDNPPVVWHSVHSSSYDLNEKTLLMIVQEQGMESPEDLGNTMLFRLDEDFVDAYTKAETDTLLSEKQDTLTPGANVQINGSTISATDTTYIAGLNISIVGNTISATIPSVGRYLALWDCTTGTPTTDPSGYIEGQPYIYITGDYYRVSAVNTLGINYKPSGASYTRGEISIEVETSNVKVGDLYLFDGSTWVLLKSSTDVSFSDIKGLPSDNTNLATALNGKANTTHTHNASDITGLSTVATSGNYNDLSNKPIIPAAQIQSDWNQTNTSAKDFIKNKPVIPTNTCPVGTIIMWAGDKGNAKTWTDTATSYNTHTYYEPVEGWLLCDGASYFRSNNPGDYLEGTLELANIIGSNYGTSYSRYKLPDLSGRFPLGVGNSSTTGATSHSLADKGGQEAVTLTAAQSGLPSHQHWLAGAMDAVSGSDVYPALTYHTTLARSLTEGTLDRDAQEAHTNMPPYLTLNFLIKYK